MLGNLQNDIINNFLFLLLRILREILLSFQYVIVKYIMEIKYVSVYEMCFYNGIINLILLGIFSIIDYYYFKIDNLEEYFNNFNSKELIVILGVMITQFGLNLSILFTIKNNSPCHVFIIFVFGRLAYYINFSGYSIIVIICLIFILFLSLIFNEIIEINCFGLSHNTKRNITERSEIESEEDFLSIKNETIDESTEKDEDSIELTNSSIYN